ncbi:hypothetical protein ACFY4C_02015 [Actinomadura viridis]|uniref:hypothetical protein n=1 Tax=Actinomadura viridis TaxID=58110 RepID=UPI0036A7890A
MAGTRRVPRSRGALSGTLLVLLGLWGGLLPYVGPYFDFGFAPDRPWVHTADRLQLSVAPAVAVGLGGLVVLAAAGRAAGAIGAWLAALGGAWFVVGGPVAALWDVQGAGAPLGAEEGRRLAEQLAGFSGLGVVAVFLAAVALGRFTVAGPPVDAEYGDGEDRDAAPEREEWSGFGGSSRTTQPLAPAFGRYARPHREPPAGGQGPYQAGPPHPSDQHVAGEQQNRP